MMTRKHFKIIVDILEHIPMTNKTRLKTAERAASILETENPRFDKEKFIKACMGLK